MKVLGVQTEVDRDGSKRGAAGIETGFDVGPVVVLGNMMTEISRSVLGIEDEKDKVSDLANRDPVPLWLNLAAGWRYCRKSDRRLQGDQLRIAERNVCLSLLELFAVKEFQIILLELLFSAEDASSCLSAHVFVILFAANKRSCVYAVVSVKTKGGQRIAEFLNLFREVNGLIVEHHADGIVARRAPVGIKAPRFVDENADFLGALIHDLVRLEITKARISSRLRQESFPRAGDLGFRPCRRIFYQNRLPWRKGAKLALMADSGFTFKEVA